MSRPTEIQINLEALRSNCELAQSLAPDSKTIAVVKADAYGHGSEYVATALDQQVDMFAVSSLNEALVLKNAGVLSPLLLLEGCFSAEEFDIASRENIQMVIHNQEQVNHLVLLPEDRKLCVWLKVDTGMHRLGVSFKEAADFYKQLVSLNQVKDVVLMSHLASADNLNSDYTSMQLSRFSEAVKDVDVEAERSLAKSVANSAGLIAWPESRMDWNRPGIMLYGLSPFADPHPIADKLRPVMSFKSKVIAVREIEQGERVGYGSTWAAPRKSVIATVAVGYGDGYPRNARSGTPVLVNGQRGALAGRVSMDMISVDVTDIGSVKVNDEVELWGENLLANEVAGWADSIGYELVTRMPKRTPRIIG